MAAKKVKKARAGGNPPATPPPPAADPRLAVLAQELGYAGMQTLIEDYGWSRDEATTWLTKMLAHARANREATRPGDFANGSTTPDP